MTQPGLELPCHSCGSPHGNNCHCDTCFEALYDAMYKVIELFDRTDPESEHNYSCADLVGDLGEVIEKVRPKLHRMSDALDCGGDEEELLDHYNEN